MLIMRTAKKATWVFTQETMVCAFWKVWYLTVKGIYMQFALREDHSKECECKTAHACMLTNRNVPFSGRGGGFANSGSGIWPKTTITASPNKATNN